MSVEFPINEIQTTVGYSFGSTELLKTAFTHRSAITGKQISNEGLIFLGKAVGELLIRDYLYSNFNFTEITELNRTLFNEEDYHLSWVSKCGSNLRLNTYVVISDSASAIKNSRILEEELFLAVTAAIYKDGGMPAVRAFIIPKLKSVISAELPELNSAHASFSHKEASHTQTAAHTLEGANKKASESKKEKISSAKYAASALKNLFSSKKCRSEETENAQDKNTENIIIQESEIKLPVSEHNGSISDTSTYKQRSNDTQKTPKTSNNEKAPKSSPPSSNKKTNKTNYKSTLQEYIQKSLHSPTLTLEYIDKKLPNGKIECEIHLFGKKIAVASEATKKEASQTAAQIALKDISEPNASSYEWFHKQIKSNQHTQNTENDSKKITSTDYISRLNHTIQKRDHVSSVPLTYEKLKAASAKTFAVAVAYKGKELGRGEGKTLKEAKQNAARAALSTLSITI